MKSQTYKNILVAIDAFADYHKILERALTINGGTEGVSVVHVTLPEVYFAPYGETATTQWLSEARDRASQKLNKVAAEYSISEAHAFLVGGPPSEEIQSLADDLDVDMIVMGTHGQRGVRLLLGSTANAVLQGVRRDVLLVRI